MFRTTAIRIYFASLTLIYMQITVHPLDFAGDKNVEFEFPDACLFGQPLILALKIL